MRYIEQVKYSWGYHWQLFQELWDIFTLRGWYRVIVGLLVVLCVVPSIVFPLTPFTVRYYTHNPFPSFAPSLSQELAVSDYYGKVPEKPSFLLVFNYCWVIGRNYQPLAQVLCVATAGLLAAVCLREE